MSNFTYWLRTLFGLPVYFYCRYVAVSVDGLSYVTRCMCYGQNEHTVGHPTCEHCTPSPHVQCRVCHVTYFDSVPPNPEVWTFSLWRGWRHVACHQ